MLPCKKSKEAASFVIVQVSLKPYLGIQSLNAAPSAAQKSSSGVPSAFVGWGDQDLWWYARCHVPEVLPHYPGMLFFSSDHGDAERM